MEKYFLPIRSENLGSYFRTAIIKPSIYYQNKRNNDIQEQYPNFLLMSLKQSIKGDNSDCSLELILTEDEKEKLNPLNAECFLFEKPLPITRIKSIRFESIEQREITINTIRLNTGFIPEILISKDNSFEKADNAFRDINPAFADSVDKIEKFNHQLGGLALMRLVTSENETYSEHYFSLLAKYNKKVEELMKNTPLDRDKDKNFMRNRSLVEQYYKNRITDEIIKEIAEKENQKLKKTPKKRTYNLDTLDGATYFLAFIRDHQANDNDEGRDKIDNYIITRFAKVKYPEDLAFYYGYNKGYSAFSKSYLTRKENEINFKYTLETLLDYYTIESIYQYCVNGNRNNDSFPFLDDLFEKRGVDKTKTPLKSNQINILGEIITYKKKEISLPGSEVLSDHNEIKEMLERIERMNERMIQQSEMIERMMIQLETINELMKHLEKEEPSKPQISVPIYDLIESEILREPQVEYEPVPKAKDNEKIGKLIKELEDYLKTLEVNKKPAKTELKKILDSYKANQQTTFL